MIRDIARWVALGGVFVLPFLPLVVANSLFFPYITGKNFLFRIIVEVIFAAWVILACCDARYRPRFSYILAGFGALVGVMAVANALGVSPHKSFWSNYERMDGYVTLIHLALYFVVVGTMLTTERMWNAFWNTSVVVAIFMMLYGFCQLSGSTSCPIGQGGDFRIDSRMGNAAYLAIYMFFHIFVSLLLFFRTSNTALRVSYGILSVGFAFILLQTATRGTTLALFGGIFVTVCYMALFERTNVWMRKMAIAAVVLVLIVGGGFYSARNTDIVKSNPVLERLTAVSFKELTTRMTIWSLAVEGIKERPVLGWGQENFNYVFNQNYKASLYAQEPWFDRVHNLMLDWLIAGGILGLLAYLSVLLSAVYYVAIRPFTHKDEETFTVAERAVLLGLLAGYTAHNLLVFDNLISYLFFASIIAMIHTRVSREMPRLSQIRMSDEVVTQIVAPVAVVVACVAIYMVNIPSLQAAGDMIKGFQAQDPSKRLQEFKTALSRGSFADQEIREQTVRLTQEISSQVPNLVQQMRTANPKLSEKDANDAVQKLRMEYVTLADTAMKAQLEETPNDVRILVFQASFYRVIGDPAKALEVLERAKTLSPEKQQIYFELGLAALDTGDKAKAEEAFKTAYDLEPKFSQARLYYAMSAIYAGDLARAQEIVGPEYQNDYVRSDAIVRALLETKQYGEMENIYKARIEQNPNDIQLRVSLAWIQNTAGRKTDAIATIQAAIEKFPDFKAQGERYIKDLEGGATPQK